MEFSPRELETISKVTGSMINDRAKVLISSARRTRFLLDSG